MASSITPDGYTAQSIGSLSMPNNGDINIVDSLRAATSRLMSVCNNLSAEKINVGSGEYSNINAQFSGILQLSSDTATQINGELALELRSDDGDVSLLADEDINFSAEQFKFNNLSWEPSEFCVISQGGKLYSSGSFIDLEYNAGSVGIQGIAYNSGGYGVDTSTGLSFPYDGYYYIGFNCYVDPPVAGTCQVSVYKNPPSTASGNYLFASFTQPSDGYYANIGLQGIVEITNSDTIGFYLQSTGDINAGRVQLTVRLVKRT